MNAAVNGCGIKLTWPEHGIFVTLDRFRDQHGATKAELSAYVSGETPQLLTQANLNLCSIQGRASFARRLFDLYPSVPWNDIVENAAVHGMRIHRKGEPVMPLQPASAAHVSYLLDPFIYENHPSLFYAPGGTLKSYFALYLALLGSHGANQDGLRALQCPVLILDWELNYETVGGRLKALQAGHPELSELVPYYRRCEAPLYEEVNQIAEAAAEHNVKLLILDSAAMACGGDLNSPDTVIKLTRALRTIGCASLLLAHTAKMTSEGQERTAYGSVYFRELARSVWQLDRSEEDGPVRVMLCQKKNNFGPLHSPLGFEFRFDGETVRVVASDLAAEPAFEEHLSLAARIRNLLEDGKPRTTEAIAQALKAKEGSVKATLSRHNKVKWHRIGDYHEGAWTVNR